MLEMVLGIRCPPLVDPPLSFPPLVHAVAASATAATSPIRAFELRIYLSPSVRSAIRYAPGVRSALSTGNRRWGARSTAPDRPSTSGSPERFRLGTRSSHAPCRAVAPTPASLASSAE